MSVCKPWLWPCAPCSLGPLDPIWALNCLALSGEEGTVPCQPAATFVLEDIQEPYNELVIHNDHTQYSFTENDPLRIFDL